MRGCGLGNLSSTGLGAGSALGLQRGAVVGAMAAAAASSSSGTVGPGHLSLPPPHMLGTSARAASQAQRLSKSREDRRCMWEQGPGLRAHPDPPSLQTHLPVHPPADCILLFLPS